MALIREPGFLTALEAVLEVLPVVEHVDSGWSCETRRGGAACSDFDALEHLRRLAFADQVHEPEQLRFWAEESQEPVSSESRRCRSSQISPGKPNTIRTMVRWSSSSIYTRCRVRSATTGPRVLLGSRIDARRTGCRGSPAQRGPYAPHRRLHAGQARSRCDRAGRVSAQHRGGEAPYDATDRDFARRGTQALELLRWMVALGPPGDESRFAMRRAPPRDRRRRRCSTRRPASIEDKAGNRLAFNGSVNETAQGWRYNWESFHVFCDWDGGKKHVDAEESTFSRLWADKSPRARVMDVPAAVREDLLRFLPREGCEPERLKRLLDKPTEAVPPPEPPVPAGLTREERRRAVWEFVWTAPRRADGVTIAEATSAVVPWPHQVRAFQRMVDRWPPRLLIADEVGLGKTIEAGMLLRYAWLSGRAKRVLVLAPKGLLVQWQLELREKFNLNWPIYDGRCLRWYPSPALRGRHEREVPRDEWHREPFVIASSQLMRRRERQAEMVEHAEPWDLIVLDEAHHARRKSPGSAQEGPPNLLLRLAEGLSRRTQGLLLLTATPMQVHPVEVWDLLALLGMPADWTRAGFVQFFRKAANPSLSHDEFDALSRMFQAAERAFGPMPLDAAIRRTPGRSRLKAQRILRALRDRAGIPRRQLSTEERRVAQAMMRAHTPVAALVSRHTRDLLREYQRRGLLSTPIAKREVVDEFLQMTPGEAQVYAELEDYISTTYNNASQENRSAVGFVMTIYRKRLASSFFALRRTLEERLRLLEDESRSLDAGTHLRRRD